MKIDQTEGSLIKTNRNTQKLSDYFWNWSFMQHTNPRNTNPPPMSFIYCGLMMPYGDIDLRQPWLIW